MKNRKLIHLGWFIAAAAIFSGAVMFIWNWTIPHIFNAQEINFWQALGLLVLSKLLFGTGRMMMPYRKNHMRNKWEEMSPEARQRFYERMKKHHHYHFGDGNFNHEQPEKQS